MKTALLCSMGTICACVAGAGEIAVDDVGSYSYVTNGLNALWDGADNVGYGAHDASAATWVDLVGGKEFTLHNLSWGPDYLQFAGNLASYADLPAADTVPVFGANEKTVEFVTPGKNTGTDFAIVLKGPMSIGACFGFGNGTFALFSTGGYKPVYSIGSPLVYDQENNRTFSADYIGSVFQTALVNNENTVLSGKDNYFGQDLDHVLLGQRDKGGTSDRYPFDGRLTCIRVYNRILTATEKEWNYAVDRVRFHGDDPNDYEVFKNNDFAPLKNDKLPTVGAVTVTPVANGIRFSVDILKLGEGSSSADVKIAVAPCDALTGAVTTMTNATATGVATFEVKGLVSDLYYNYMLSVVNSGGMGRNVTGEALTGGLKVRINSRSYITDGLVANWDGIDNIGFQAHTNAPTDWIDLVDGRKVALNSATAETNAIYFTGTTNPYSYGELSADDTAATFAKRNDMTLELCSRSDSANTEILLKSSIAAKKAFGFLKVGVNPSLIAYTGESNVPMFGTTADDVTSVSTWTIVYGSSGVPDTGYCNGAVMTKSGNEYWGQDTAGTTFGVRKSTSNAFSSPAKCHLHSVRLYDGAISEASRAWNQAVDDVRFRGADARRYTIFTNNLVEVRREESSGLEFSSACESPRASECDLALTVTATGGEASDTCEAWVAHGADAESMSEYVRVAADLALNSARTVTVARLDGGRYCRFSVKLHNLVTDGWSDVKIHNVLVKEPYTFDGFGYEDTDDGLKVKVSVSTFNITSATVRVRCGGEIVGTAPVTGSGAFDFTIEGVHSGAVTAEIASDYGDTVRTLSVKPGATGYVMSDFAECSSSVKTLILHVGDTVSLPVRHDGTAFQTLNPRVLSYADGILTAADVGIAGVADYASTQYANGFFTVIPEVSGGGVYIYDENSDRTWCDPLAWRKAGTTDRTSYPSANGDIAVFPLTSFKGPVTIREDITISALLLGGAVNEASSFRLRGGNGATLTFSHPDANGKARVYFSSNLRNDRVDEYFRPMIGGSDESERLRIALARDTIVDLGGPAVAHDDYSDVDRVNNNLRLWLETFATVDVPAGIRLVHVGGVPTASFYSSNTDDGCAVFFGNDFRFTGSGKVVHNSPATVTLAGDCLADFEGTVVSGMRNFATGRSLVRSGPFHVRVQNADSAKLSVAGFLGTDFSLLNSCGLISEGYTYTHGEPTFLPGNAFAAAGLVLEGGCVAFGSINRDKENFHPIYDTDGETILDYECLNETACLDVSGGLSYLANDSNPAAAHPKMTFRANSLRHDGCGVLAVRDDNVTYNLSSRRVITQIRGTAGHVVGYAGEADFDNDVYPVVPWLVTRYSIDGSTATLSSHWAVFGSDGQVTRDYSPAYVTLDEVTDTNRNVWVKGTGIALTADRTVNSLVLGNNGQESRLGEGLRLAIRSGALMFKDGGSSIGTAAGGEANGTVAFGGKAYVYAYQLQYANLPNCLYAKAVAPQGLVSCYPGYFALGGDQTGIDGELAVLSGVTYLGSPDGTLGCKLDVPVRVVGGGAKVIVTQPNGGTLKNRIVRLEGPGGILPKLELPAGTTEECRLLCIDGEPQPVGVYGAIGSGAQYECDFITGTGLLEVKTDKLNGLMLILR